jgi:hypothetical protein
VSRAEEPRSGPVPAGGDAAQWREAARLREKFGGWVVVWLAREEEFRAYRRLPGARRDTTLAAATSGELAAKIQAAERAHASRGAGSEAGQS